MNKFSKKIHHQFITGKINGTVFGYLQKMASGVTNDKLFDKHLEKLSNFNIQTVEDCQQYFDIYTNIGSTIECLALNKISEKQLENACDYVFLNRNNYNFSNKHNYIKATLDFIKNSHPNNAGVESTEPMPTYDLDKWVETMRYIYNTANTNNLPLDGIAKQVTAKWDENERINFQRWMRYYQEGNYSKYNVKTAQFFSNKQETTKTPDMKPVQDMFQNPAVPKPDPTAGKKQRLDEARKKLRGRLKSVEELLEMYRDVLPQDVTTSMRRDVFDLKEKILGLELKASLVDSIMRTSNQFTKHGFIEGANELKKIAQEVAEDKLPEPPVEAAPPAPTPSAPPVDGEKDHVRVPEVNIGEEKIEIPDFSSATHRDALQKLEEINKVISERNVVRALAAVDIILGQLGIASYFPQLSEAQSKLMDAFNYAGTRVAETIGQMRGGSGGPIKTPENKPKEEAVEVSEEVEKPVGEVVPGSPAPKAPAQPAPVIK